MGRCLAWFGAWGVALLLFIDLGRDKCPLLIGG